MASDTELAAKPVAPMWVVGPTEDVVQSLMETLVDPLLPLRVSNVPPSQDTQKSVAKQMHAVVLLYNYYHRKQKPELVFLDFVSFCKLALVVRPTLIAFMKLMMDNKSMGLNGAEDLLSVTEKAIKSACGVAEALDASINFPNTEGWPFSKVAVLLIDSKKENCWLQFGSVTEGVWSPIEKEINDSSIKPETSSEQKVGYKRNYKRKQNGQKASTDDTEFLQQAYDAVKDATGIGSSDLEVLETHVTYSLSKEKSAARLYMMQCPGSFSKNKQVPLKFLVESLQGPLAEKLSFGFWKTTPVIEYHHMIPYVEFISCWLSGSSVDNTNKIIQQEEIDCEEINLNILSNTVHFPTSTFQHYLKLVKRKSLCLSNLNGCKAESTMSSCEKEPTQSRTSSLPASKYYGSNLDHIDHDSCGMKAHSSEKISNAKCYNNKKCKLSSTGEVKSPVNVPEDSNVTEEFNKTCDVLASPKNSPSRNTENSANDSQQCDKGSLSGPSRDLSQNMVKDDNSLEKTSIVGDSATEEASRIKLEALDSRNDDRHEDLLSDPLRGFSKEAVIHDNVAEKINQKHDIFGSEEESKMYAEILDEDSSKSRNDSLSGPTGLRTNMHDFTKTWPYSEDKSKKVNSNVRIYHYRRKNHSSAPHNACVQDGVNLKVDMVDSSKSYHNQCTNDKLSGNKVDIDVLCDQNGTAAIGIEAKTEHDVDVEQKSVSASEELQNALVLLHRKRQELHSQLCSLEDTLALYEDNIARIRDGGEVGLARQCIKSIISGNNRFPLEHGKQIRDGAHRHADHNCKSQHEKQTNSSETYVPGKSSCQDLDYVCLKNDWRLPRYFIEPSDGKFLSQVFVRGKDVELSSKGSFESKPCQARESAAVNMIAKIRGSPV